MTSPQPEHRWADSTGQPRKGNLRNVCACGHKTPPTRYMTQADRDIREHIENPA